MLNLKGGEKAGRGGEKVFPTKKHCSILPLPGGGGGRIGGERRGDAPRAKKGRSFFLEGGSPRENGPKGEKVFQLGKGIAASSSKGNNKKKKNRPERESAIKEIGEIHSKSSRKEKKGGGQRNNMGSR